MKNFVVICFFLLLSAGCKKNEELLDGNITGMVLQTDQYHSEKSIYDRVPLANATVNLYQESTLIGTTSSDVNGNYLFTGMSYGKYKISAEKDGYVSRFSALVLYHVGGGSASIQDIYMEEIPTFQLSIDSAKYYDGYNFIIYVKLDGQPNYPVTSMGNPVMIFASDLPDVTYEKYKSKGVAYTWDIKSWQPYEICPMYAKTSVTSISHMDDNFYELQKNSLYVRIYPAVESQLDFMQLTINPEFLGKPSNVIQISH